MIEAVILSSIAFALFLIVHFLWFHYKKPKNGWQVVTRIALFFLIVYIISAWLIPYPNWFSILDQTGATSKIFAIINGVIIYIFLFFSYAQFYFLIDRSVSARIMIELLQSPTGSLRVEDIHNLYDPKGMQKRRITDMLYGGYIIEKDNTYHMTARGKRNAAVFMFFKKFLHLYPGG
jgi:hypothetical protein